MKKPIVVIGVIVVVFSIIMLGVLATLSDTKEVYLSFETNHDGQVSSVFYVVRENTSLPANGTIYHHPSMDYEVNLSWTNIKKLYWNVGAFYATYKATIFNSPPADYNQYVIDNIDVLNVNLNNSDNQEVEELRFIGVIDPMGVIITTNGTRSLWEAWHWHSDTLYTHVPVNSTKIEVYFDWVPPDPTVPPILIKKNVWTWLGYLNNTAKTGKALYEQIPNCRYVVMQDITTGYYYTYGETLPRESFTITQGSAVAVLVSHDTYWDRR